MPGFTNRKPKHQDVKGLFPFARLLACGGDTFPQAEAFYEELVSLLERQEAERLEFRNRSTALPLREAAFLTLAHFRDAQRYAAQPAAADMAFAIAAYAHGWSDSDIAAELAANYLYRDNNQKRRDAYLRRTLTKAAQWARRS